MRMDVDISRLLARALVEQLPVLPWISLPFLALDLVTAPWEHLFRYWESQAWNHAKVRFLSNPSRIRSTLSI